MDKLKEQLAVVKEHSFWIMCGGILLVSLVSWYMSTSHLQSQQKKYKGEIETAETTLKGVNVDIEVHPNDSTSKGMDAVMLSFGEDVYQAWARLAENQEKVLVWEGFFGSDPQFQREVRPLRPIETTVGEITTDSRTLYRMFIGDQIPLLAEIIRAKWQVDAQPAAGMPGGGGAGAGMPGAGGEGFGGAGGMPGMPGGGGAAAAKDNDPSVVVTWNPSNQREITQVHFSLATNETIPSTLEVLYAQEDLWVFKNLMGIIRATNGDATRKHEAAIKYIDYVRIGLSAGDVKGKVTMLKGGTASGDNMGGGMPGMQGGGGGMPGMQGGGGMPSGGGGGMPAGAPGAGGAGGMAAPGGMAPGGMAPGGSGGPGGGMPGSGTAAQTAGSGRYVDLSYASIQDISRLRSALKEQAAKPEDMLLAVAKRMPVRMQFKMDQRKLTTLLANCGNSQLPVEVRQVQINRGTASSLGGGGGMPGMGGGMPGMGGGMPTGAGAGAGAGMGLPSGDEGGGGAAGGGGMGGGMMPGGLGGGGAGNARPASSIASSKEDPNEIDVEIYGIVYIYNPPDRKLLGISDPAGASPTIPAAPVVPTATPASTSPTPATPPNTSGAATGR